MTLELYPGWFSLGGNEIINSERARGILESLDCPTSWFKRPPCIGARGETGYTYDTIGDAPWYDLDTPDVSGNFYGIYALDVTEVSDSTRESSLQQSILNGGTIGRTRLSTREFRVRAQLFAKNAEALSYGRSWLEAATLPGACGQHGTRCGLTDLEFLIDCPPDPADITKDDITTTVTRKNLAINPSGGGEVDGSGVPTSWSSTGFTLSQGERFAGAATSVSAVRNATGSARITVGMAGYVPSTQYTIVATFQTVQDVTITASLRPNGVSTTGQGQSGPVDIPAGVSTQSFIVTTTATAPGATSTLSFLTSSGLVGMVIGISDVLVVPTTTAVWTETRRNMFQDPHGTASIFWESNAAVTESLGPALGTSPTSRRFTRTTTAAARASMLLGTDFTASVPWTVTATLLSSVDIPTGIRAVRRYNITGGGADVFVTPPLVAGVPYEMVINFTNGSSVPSGTAGIAMIWSEATVGATLDIANVMFEQTGTIQPYFDGDSIPSGPLSRYLWVGTPNNSYSIEEQTPEPSPGTYFDGDTPAEGEFSYSWDGTPNASASIETRTVITPVPDPERYAEIMNSLTRYLHAAAVTSGPTTTDELRFRSNDVVSQIVEFSITSERSWVYGKTRAVDLPRTDIVIIQDIPFNFVEYPSAELPGANVEIARNYFTNPSVETNATGWSATATAVTGTAPAAYFTSARTTTGLKAVGAASFGASIIGNGSTEVASSTASVVIQQDVALGTVPANSRISFNLWVAAVIAAGSAVSAITSLRVEVEWRTASAPLSTTVIGTATPSEYSGNAYSMKSQLPPATATIARVRAVIGVTWRSSATAANNSNIQMYADALAVTVP